MFFAAIVRDVDTSFLSGLTRMEMAIEKSGWFERRDEDWTGSLLMNWKGEYPSYGLCCVKRIVC